MILWIKNYKKFIIFICAVCDFGVTCVLRGDIGVMMPPVRLPVTPWYFMKHKQRNKMAYIWYFADSNFKLIFFNENVWRSNEISLKYVPEGQ